MGLIISSKRGDGDDGDDDEDGDDDVVAVVVIFLSCFIVISRNCIGAVLLPDELCRFWVMWRTG